MPQSIYHSSTHSLTSNGSGAGGKRYLKVLQNYNAADLDELSLKRSERVEILNDTGPRWLVKNRMGEQGYVPAQLLEGASIRGTCITIMIRI